MAKLYFYYSSMNAGKSTILLQSSYNYQEMGMKTMLFTAALDDRYGTRKISSRIGLEAEADLFGRDDDLYAQVERRHKQEGIACVLVDEAQFLTKGQVEQLTDVADHLSIPVIAYGLRTDFQGQLFPGSERLLAIADEMREVKTICRCGKKATMVLRLGENGRAVKDGEQVVIGGNNRYVSVCRTHWKAAMAEQDERAHVGE